MQNEWIYGYAATIKERIFLLKNKYKNLDTSPYYQSWRARKTLVSNENFQDMLHTLNITKEEFGLGIVTLDEEMLKELFIFVRKQSWYIRHKEFLKLPIPHTCKGFRTALRFHIGYMKKYIKTYLLKKTDITLSTEAMKSIEKGLFDDLFSIAQRTFVWDVHDIKNRAGINSESKEAEMEIYLNIRFGTSDQTELFFLEYPALARILSDRVQFFIDNIMIFFDSIISSSKQLASVFYLKPPYNITDFQFTNGDSHHLGKKPIIFQVNHTKLVYKFRCGFILQSYNKLITYLESMKSDFRLLKVDCVSSDKFCFEKYIEHIPCKNSSEIEIYYKNYGYLAALMHFLGASDIHMENLIAHSFYPVPIDLETLFGAEERRTYSSQYNKFKLAQSDSVILSGLLPMQKYWKHQIDISALNGICQKIPYKVRRLIHENTTDIMYQLDDAFLPEAQNLPLLNGRSITYTNYTSIIESGYLSMMSILVNNRKFLFHYIRQLFSNVRVRVLLRDTQDYQNFLSFSTHPSCMVNYAEREKIFENLWDHSFITSSVVKYEIDALKQHDIPYFYTYINSLDLYSDNGNIEMFFRNSLLHNLKKHLNTFTKKRMHISHLLLQESLNMLYLTEKRITIDKRNHEVSLPLLEYAANIGDHIIDQIIIDNDHKLLIWPSIINHMPGQFYLDFPDSNIYYGSAGLLIFYSHLNHFVKKKKYTDLIKILEHEVFETKEASKYNSAYWGSGSKVTTAFLLYRITKNIRYLNTLKNKLLELELTIDHLDCEEWLYGKASLIAILSRISAELQIPVAFQILKQLITKFNIHQLQYPGFAHGYAGILYALIRAREIVPIASLDDKINEVFELLIKNSQKKELNASWCNGTLGINKAINAYQKLRNMQQTRTKTDFNLLTDSCLCHGQFGTFSAIIEDFMNDYITYEQYQIIFHNLIHENPLILKGNEMTETLGLFTGLAGVGYQLLFIQYPFEMINILYL